METDVAGHQSDAQQGSSGLTDRTPVYDSVRNRKRNVFGTIAFMPPIVGEQSQKKKSGTRQSPAALSKKRQQQLYQAQRDHRRRKKEYMDILEQEIFRLRVDKEQLNQVAEDWRKCCLILTKVEPLLALQHTAPAFMRQLGPQVSFGPGIESWHNATDSHLQVSRGLPLRTVASEYQQSMQPTIHSFQNHFHRLGVNEPLGPVLFQNFYEDITPTLCLTERSKDGYIKYMLPLAMSDKTALCSVLAASASHARLSMATLHLSVAYPLKYRSMALRGLQERAAHANSKADPDNPVCLVALTTILGLLIDDLITYRGEFPALTQLADFWTRKYVSPDQDCYDSTVFHFLAEQITIMKHLITPLYRMSSSQAPANKIRFPQAQEHLLSQRQLIIPDAARLCNMFSALQNATAQAVKIYRLSRMDDEHHTDQKSLRDKQNKLLDALQSTIDDVPPFTLGENALVWALYTAAMSSTRMAHRIFFTSKLAAILERVELDEANRPWYM